MAYATWNPSDKHADITLSNGNLTAANSVGGYKGVRATLGVTSGQHYWEITVDAGINLFIGVADSSADLGDILGNDAHGWSYEWGGN